MDKLFALVAFGVVALIINYQLAKQFYLVACNKGYFDKKYKWIPFFCGIAGYLLVIALPDRKTNTAYTSFKKEDLPDI